MYKPSPIQKAIINELMKRSSINVEIGIDKIETWCKVNSVKCNFRASGGGMATNGTNEYLFYYPDNFPARKQEQGYITAVLFHEMAHATKNNGRVPREFCDWTGNMEEVVAEMTSKSLAIHFDIITNISRRLHDEYIESFGGWLSRDEMCICKEYSEKCVEYILNNWLIDFDKSRIEVA